MSTSTVGRPVPDPHVSRLDIAAPEAAPTAAEGAGPRGAAAGRAASCSRSLRARRSWPGPAGGWRPCSSPLPVVILAGLLCALDRRPNRRVAPAIPVLYLGVALVLQIVTTMARGLIGVIELTRR